MSELEFSLSDSEGDTYIDVNAKNNKNSKDLFELMIELSRSNKDIPLQYVKDMIKMHSKCTIEQQNSKKLCSLIVDAVENIPINNDAFQCVAKVYNKLLQLSKNDLTTLKAVNCVPSTSNGSASISSDGGEEAKSYIVSNSTKMFNDFIQKCYQNENFPKSNIEVIDKLYKSLPLEFVESKHFLLLLKEANQIIWPDSRASLYVHVQHIYEQLLQFETSMKIQDKNLSEENMENKMKKYQKLKKLKKAMKNIRKRIQILDEKEMDINDSDEFDSDSAYILKHKYEKRLIEIYKRMCKIMEEPDYLEESKLRFTGTNDKLVNKTIEKYYNLKKIFPDHFEIYTLLKLLNSKKKLGWTEDQLKSISQNAFLKLGKQLKTKRLNDYFSGLSHMISNVDPAEENLELKKKLDESNKKLNAELNAITEKYNNIQDYAEETDGSSINDTDCENSSDEDCEITIQSMNKKFETVKNKPIESIPIKRKRLLSNESETNEPPKKSQKTVYMESFNLTPCIVALEPLKNGLVNETIIENISDKEATKENINNSEKVINILNVKSENSNHLSINAEKVANKDLNVTQNVDDCKSATEAPSSDQGNSNLVIDEVNDETIPKELQKNQVQKIGSDEQTMINNISSSSREGNSPITIMPEVVLKEDLENNVIDINDDSDVEITSCDTPKVVKKTSGDITTVKLQDKESLKNIIKSMNFDKKYNWLKAPQRSTNTISINRPSNSVPSYSFVNRNSAFSNQNSVNPNQNSSLNFENRWIMHHDVRPQQQQQQQQQQQYRPNNAYFIRPPHNNRFPLINHRIQSTIQRSHSSHSRQVTQSFSNSVQRNINNLNLLQQRVTTMTTTTTVRQVVQQTAEQSRRRLGGFSNNRSRRNVPSAPNTNGKPELIELD